MSVEKTMKQKHGIWNTNVSDLKIQHFKFIVKYRKNSILKKHEFSQCITKP